MQKNILVVDDEPITLRGIKKTLESWSNGQTNIITTSDANSAIEILKSMRIHLLITDICMPEKNGLQMIHELRESIALPVVIIISAHSDFSFAQKAIEIGVVNYLLKPINKQKLIEEVQKALEAEEKRNRVNIIEKVVDKRFVTLEAVSQKEGPIQKALTFIDSNIHSSLTLKEVANHVHLNPSYFSVVFKEQTNFTFSEYITRVRLQKAKNLLLTTSLSISEIAESVGYRTSKYFIKIFKDYEGVTPYKYKK